MIAIRVAIVLLALAAGGWLAVQERAARAEEELTTLAFDIEGRLGAAQISRIGDLLDTARRLNPDRRPDLIEAFLLLRRGREREAVALLRRVVRDEPASVEGWALLARAAARVDPRSAAVARARLRVLAPHVPRI
jgi:predicted Zn-dependent protease